MELIMPYPQHPVLTLLEGGRLFARDEGPIALVTEVLNRSASAAANVTLVVVMKDVLAEIIDVVQEPLGDLHAGERRAVRIILGPYDQEVVLVCLGVRCNVSPVERHAGGAS